MRYLVIAAGIVGFAVFMALRDLTANVVFRAVLAAIAGGSIGASLLYSRRR